LLHSIAEVWEGEPYGQPYDPIFVDAENSSFCLHRCSFVVAIVLPVCSESVMKTPLRIGKAAFNQKHASIVLLLLITFSSPQVVTFFYNTNNLNKYWRKTERNIPGDKGTERAEKYESVSAKPKITDVGT
jgi:hypothetical protein